LDLTQEFVRLDFSADFCEIFLALFLAKKNFSIGVEGTLHGHVRGLRMHERFPNETFALSKKKLDQTGRPESGFRRCK